MSTHTKLLYLTTVDITDGSAQANQIVSMSQAFAELTDYSLVAFGRDLNLGAWATINQNIELKKAKRSWYLIKTALKKDRKEWAIFTRDFYISLVLSSLGYRCVWECHQEPMSSAKRLLKFKSFLKSRNLAILSISKAMMTSVYLKDLNLAQYYYHDCADKINPSIEQISAADQALFEKHSESIKAVYTGALHKGKDVDSLEPLFQAFKHWTFLIYGGKPDEAEQYSVKFKQYPNVFLLGRRPKSEIISIQQKADVLLYPLTLSNKLFRFTSPLKLFEYMAASKPIIASRIGSITEILSDDNAFCYEEDIVAAAQRFNDADKSTIGNMVKLNTTLIENKYNWSARAKYILTECFD